MTMFTLESAQHKKSGTFHQSMTHNKVVGFELSSLLSRKVI